MLDQLFPNCLTETAQSQVGLLLGMIPKALAQPLEESAAFNFPHFAHGQLFHHSPLLSKSPAEEIRVGYRKVE